MAKKIFIVIIISLSFLTCKENNENKDLENMEEKISQYSVTEIKYDKNLLDDNQKIIVEKLYRAAKIIDEIFLDQVYSKNSEIKHDLENSEQPIDKLRLAYFNINFGPFDRFDHNKPFIDTVLKPLGANFYPEDLTKEEFENWIKAHPEDQKSFTSEFTIIRREGSNLKAIPYSVYYHDKLSKISKLLREAAEYADNQSLKNYLLLRADDLETDNFFKSDIAWMDLKDYNIEVVIGPYEVYEDELFNYKASYECFLTIVDPAETKKLETFAKYLNEMENNLPIDNEHKNFERGSDSPIIVVQEIYNAGDSKSGSQTLAFNLPNDENVRKIKGSKKVMLKNIHEAKFEKLLKPIAYTLLDSSQIKYVSFDGFFTHTLMHEMSHGIGPGFIKINGRETEVKKELKETYSKLEECKADILGMFNNKLLIEKGVLAKEFENEMWVTFLAGIFRSVRFGVREAHGASNAIIFNFILEKGGYEFDEKTLKVKVSFDKIYPALTQLVTKVLMIQATGDYEGAKELISNYGNVTNSIEVLTGKIKHIPIDIKPEFQIEKELN